MRILSTGIFAALASLGAALACSADGDGSSGGSGAASSGGSGAANAGGNGAVGFGGNGASSAGGTINVTGGTSGAGGSTLGDAACATATYEGEQIPLDMFVVYDKSGSMQPIWDTVKNAFCQFVQSTESAGIGMGL